MKKLTFLLAFCMVCSFTYAQTVINPKIGINASRLNTDPELGEISARIGWQVGLDARIGNRVYFQPGLFYYKQSSRLKTQTNVENQEPETLEENLNRQGLQLLTQVGYYIVDGDGFKLRANVGPAISLLTSVSQSETIGEDDYKGTSITGNAGLGVDIFFLTIDYNYEWGLSNVFENDTFDSGVSFKDSPKLNRSTFNVGVKFEF